MKTIIGIATAVLAVAAVSVQAGDENVSPRMRAQQAAEIAKGDPARWYKEDRTAAERLRTLRKEIQAAHRENVADCKGDKACITEAHNIYSHELKTILDRMFETL